jgi:hypothetical protein
MSSIWQQEKAPCSKGSTLGQESDEGNKDMASTEGDLRLEGTNKEAGSTGRTKDAKRQSKVNMDYGPAAAN